MVEKVDAEVVNGGKSPTAAKTEELIGSAKDVYASLTVSIAKETKTDIRVQWVEGEGDTRGDAYTVCRGRIAPGQSATH